MTDQRMEIFSTSNTDGNRSPLSPEYYTADEVARLLQLEPLAEEGGFFRRSAEAKQVLSGSDRRAYSVIYFLVTPQGFSAMHRLKTDEVWCFHAGDPVESLRLGPDGRGEWARLGLNPTANERPQAIIIADTWQGTRLSEGGRWALLSCIVVPGFVWEDFELGERDFLAATYPDFAEGVRALTRSKPMPGQR